MQCSLVLQTDDILFHKHMHTDVPTISRMRVSVDETGVEYLLSKCSDQFICSLKIKFLMRCYRQRFYGNTLKTTCCVECIDLHLSNLILAF